MKGFRWIELLLVLWMIPMLLVACSSGETAISPTPTLYAPPATVQPTVSTPAANRSPAPPTSLPVSSLTPFPSQTPFVPSATLTPACSPLYFRPVAFFPDGWRVLGLTEAGPAIFNLNTLAQESLIKTNRPVKKAALSSDGQTLALALDDFTIQLVRASDQKLLHTLKGHTAQVDALKFSPAGDRLFSGSYDSWVREWDMDGKLIKSFQPGGGEVFGLGISPDGTRLATVTFEGPPRLWDLATFKSLLDLGSGGAFSGAEAVFSPDGSELATGLGGGPVSLWKLPEGAQLWRGGNYALALSPDGHYLAVSEMDESGNNLVGLYSANGTQLVHPLEGHPSLVWKLIFSPDSVRLLSADDMELHLWDAASGALLLRISTQCPH
jgi:WD40 repeat protein